MRVQWSRLVDGYGNRAFERIRRKTFFGCLASLHAKSQRQRMLTFGYRCHCAEREPDDGFTLINRQRLFRKLELLMDCGWIHRLGKVDSIEFAGL